MKIWNLCLAAVLAMMVVVGCSLSSDDPAASSASGETSQASEAGPAADPPLGLPDEMPSAAATFTCSQLHGSCIGRSLCAANDGRQLTATGCTGANICCGFNPCLNDNPANACTTPAICRANGVTQGLAGCAAGRVCCRLQ